MSPVLECEDLSAAYDSTLVLRDVDLTVDEGEIVGVMGKNGAGKSTLMKTIIGLLEPASGVVRYEGEDLAGTSADERANAGIGYIPQGRDVFPDLTVEENLLVGESVNRERDHDLYDEVYDYFPILEERRTQKAGTMSGGQQQMLAIGRALVGNPDLLLLDEHSEGVQPSIVEEISENLRELNDELGTTVLFVEQNLGAIQDMADRCYAMERGRIVDEVGPEELRDEDAIASYLAV
ncbi:branched-chain amino acid transport system ATP-binding protein [Halarchaeum rubridurum]|uniref:ABC transporter ATP-binding protein n=1 Tax=Halarchaeum rubridurum TaxID=489911 RepID=A0A830FYM2_9EURY|nr:ABC transporter ATP-binding protein [Halarchaeum rubridurum]MBP1954552.1 branched-chain amino acid transport system ATP-binding protein [Halarchaeum rubridurum]GGM61987.1 ABC transporter ATP-binding protein [Halarchaeum rubridurum]